MVCRDPILEENRNYWTDRAPGYSEVNRLELATVQRQRWKDCIREELTRRFPDRPLADLQVLEVGTGPGFFAILLRELGCAVEEILRRNLFPIVLGGGHETTFGHFQGQHNFLKDKGKTPELGIVNFDAHFDLRPYDMGNSSGTMFRQMADVCKAEGTPYHYFPIGIQQHSNTVSLFKKAEELGVDYVLAKDLQASNLESILERMDQFLYQCDDTYITVCSDVFSSAFAPGVSAPQSLGLDPEIVLPLIKHVLRTRKVRGFDICEISPRFDQDNTTANLGAVIIFAVVNTLCRLNGLSI